MKCVLIIKPSLFRLPQEHILHKVQVKTFPPNKTFFQAAGYTSHVAKPDTST